MRLIKIVLTYRLCSTEFNSKFVTSRQCSYCRAYPREVKRLEREAEYPKPKFGMFAHGYLYFKGHYEHVQKSNYALCPATPHLAVICE